MEKMVTVFKYMPIRSNVKDCGMLRHTDISHIRDIICKKQLHFTKWSDMNDIYEGHYILEGNVKDTSIADDVRKQLLGKLKYCATCFSRSPNCHLMWAHYASSHTGVVIGVDLLHETRTKKDNNPITIDDITYLKSTSPKHIPAEKISEAVNDSSGRKLREMALQMIFTKTACWGYEQEVRMAIESSNAADGKYHLRKEKGERVRSVYLGNRIEKKDAMEIKEMCDKEGVPCHCISKVDESFQDVRFFIKGTEYLATHPIPDTEFCPLEKVLSEENYEDVE